MYVHRWRLFLGIGVLLIPITIVTTLVQWLIFRVVDLLGVVTGQGAGTFAILALAIGTAMTLLGLGLVQAATACALVEIDEGRPIGPVQAYRIALRRIRPLLRAIVLFVARVGRPDADDVPDSGRDLARRPLVPARADRRARGAVGRVGAAAERAPRARPLDPHRLARRRERRRSRSPPGRSSASR